MHLVFDNFSVLFFFCHASTFSYALLFFMMFVNIFLWKRNIWSVDMEWTNLIKCQILLLLLLLLLLNRKPENTAATNL